MKKYNIKSIIIHVLLVGSVIAVGIMGSKTTADKIVSPIIGVLVYTILVRVLSNARYNMDLLEDMENKIDSLENEKDYYIDSIILILNYITDSEETLEEKEIKIVKHIIYELYQEVGIPEMEDIFGVVGERLDDSVKEESTIDYLKTKDGILNKFETRLDELFITMISEAESEGKDVSVLEDAHMNSKIGIQDTRKNIDELTEDDVISVIESIYGGMRVIINDYFDEEILPSATEVE